MDDTSLMVSSSSPKQIPLHLLNERRKYAVGLKINGVSLDTILSHVNGRAEKMGWGVISRRTLERDIAHYYRINKVTSATELDHNEQIRTAHLDRLEKVIEKMNIHVRNSKYSWKPFEYVSALTELFKMEMSYMDAQNWNYSMANAKINNTQVNINTIFEKGGVELKQQMKPDQIKAFSDHLRGVIDQLPDDNEEIVKKSIHDV